MLAQGVFYQDRSSENIIRQGGINQDWGSGKKVRDIRKRRQERGINWYWQIIVSGFNDLWYKASTIIILFE
jgi:hypothetical protein